MLNIFDVDYTIIKKTSAWYFIKEALSQKAIKLSQLRSLPLTWLKYKMGILNTDFIEAAVKHLAGIEKKTMEKLAEEAFEKRMKAGIFSGAKELINQIKQRKEPVVFASSSIDIILKPLKHFLGIDEIIASRLEFLHGKASGHITGVSLFGENKKIAVKEWLLKNRINPRDVCFYSDSYTDIPLLEYCGKAIAVNPDRFLRREALKRDWDILRFEETLK